MCRCFHTQCRCRVSCTAGMRRCSAGLEGSLYLAHAAAAALSSVGCTAQAVSRYVVSMWYGFDSTASLATTRLHSLDKPAMLLQQQVAQADLKTEEMPTRIQKCLILTFDVIQTDCTVHVAQAVCKDLGCDLCVLPGLVTTARRAQGCFLYPEMTPT